MRISRRRFSLGLAGASLGLGTHLAWAQSFPSKPLKIIVPFPAGGTTDVVARLVAQRMSESMGQPVVVENRGGAGGAIGADAVAKSAPDGHTLLMHNLTFPMTSVAQTLANRSPFNVDTDFAGVSISVYVPFMWTAHPSVPAKDLRELGQLLRAQKLPYNYGSTVCYQDDGVYVQGTRVGSAEEYAQQATTLAEQGGANATIAKDDQWRPLGVFALARSEETNPSTFMSLAIDKDGLLRGTYYDAVSDSTMNITGKVDKKSQRAAWTIGDKKTPVYEAGISNLTQQQTTILVHRDGGKVEQMLLVRVDDKAGGEKDSAAGAANAPGGPPAGAPVGSAPGDDGDSDADPG